MQGATPVSARLLHGGSHIVLHRPAVARRPVPNDGAPVQVGGICPQREQPASKSVSCFKSALRQSLLRLVESLNWSEELKANVFLGHLLSHY